VSRSEGNGSDTLGVSQVEVLDAGQVQVRQDEQGRLRVVLPDGSEHSNVRVVPAFPITRPDRLFYLMEEGGRELGLLAEPKRLDRDSRRLVFAEADLAYFMPHITRILDVQESTGLARWEVETDRGVSTFDVVSRSESVWWMGRSRVVLRDAHGNRYLIEDLEALDRRSKVLADLYL